MITVPSEQPAGTTYYVTRRPDIFWEQCAPCEEILAGPFDAQSEAFRHVPIVRSWGDYVEPMGVLAVRPTCLSLGTLTPRYERDGLGGVRINDQPTRLSAETIRRVAVERRESLERAPAPGFELKG
ncbi:MAG: hypothetical protein JSU86_07845 [Phycisphaerales bacterium]|nr:MAG: hypothetical protein JSU86_07845 [Phycisphaerales bacterium]